MKWGKVLGTITGGIASYAATMAALPLFAGLAHSAGWTAAATGMTQFAGWAAGGTLFGGLIQTAAAGVSTLLGGLGAIGLGVTASYLLAGVIAVGAGILISNLCQKIGSSIDNKVAASKAQAEMRGHSQEHQMGGPGQDRAHTPGQAVTQNPLLSQNQAVDYGKDPNHPAHGKADNHFRQQFQQRSTQPRQAGVGTPG